MSCILSDLKQQMRTTVSTPALASSAVQTESRDVGGQSDCLSDTRVDNWWQRDEEMQHHSVISVQGYPMAALYRTANITKPEVGTSTINKDIFILATLDVFYFYDQSLPKRLCMCIILLIVFDGTCISNTKECLYHDAVGTLSHSLVFV